MKKLKKTFLNIIIILLMIVNTGCSTMPKHYTENKNEWQLILVNKENYIPENYKTDLMELSNGQKVDKRIYPSLQQMFDDARKDGVYMVVAAGYRTDEKQCSLMEEKIQEFKNQGYSNKKSKEMAEKWVAVPGTSEHQLGLSVDINQDMQYSTADTVYKWLDENSYKYGFVKRYPLDKVKITGINNEPWHYRYVGKEAAKEMYEKDLCLEEYLNQLD